MYSSLNNQALVIENKKLLADLKEAVRLLDEGTYKINCYSPCAWVERRDTLINKRQEFLGQIYEAG